MNKKNTYFIWGNQPMELKEQVQKLIDSILPKEKQEGSVFHYSAEGFFKNDPSSSQSLINDFQSTCETISFFAEKTIVHISNLQKIPARKSPLKTIQTKLNDINLFKIPDGDTTVWYDADTLSQQVETHYHITGKQLVKKIVQYEDKSIYLELSPDIKDRLINRKKGNKEESIEITEFIKSKIKGNLCFTPPENKVPLPDTDGSALVTLLTEYIEDPPDHIVLIFTANIKNLREVPKTVTDLLQKHARVTKTTVAYDDFKPLPWVMHRASDKGVQLDRVTAELLIDLAGTDFSILDMELNKLSILFPAGSHISPEDLLENISHSKKFTIFRITGFLFSKNIKNSLELLDQILGENSSDAIGLFGLIASQFRKLVKISWLMEEGLPDKHIIQKLKLNPWVGKQLMGYTRNFSTIELENILIYMSKIDLQLKYYANEALVILQNLCFQICQNTFQETRHITRHWVPVY